MLVLFVITTATGIILGTEKKRLPKVQRVVVVTSVVHVPVSNHTCSIVFHMSIS